MRTAASIWLLAAILFLFPASSQPAPCEVGPTIAPADGVVPRTTVLISDLHLGVGKTAEGSWDPYEDFRWAPEFALFLEEINRHGGGATDLVLLGDSFELWQSRESDCADGDADLGCTEAESERRLERVASQHAGELATLRKFAMNHDNRVVLVPGNHDAALLFPAVGARALELIGANAERVTVATDGTWRSADGMIFAEHGHQIGADVNRFEAWPRPFVAGVTPQHLQRTWGERFVQRYYNDFERAYPIIDNLSNETAGVRYGVSAEGVGGSALAIASFLRFFLTEVSFAQFIGALGDESGKPDWNVPAIRSKGDAFLVESIPSDDPLRSKVAEALENGTLGARLTDFSEDEIRTICDIRAAEVAKQERARRTRTVTECPRSTQGALAEAAFNNLDDILRKHLNETRARPGVPKTFSLYVYGHTHREFATRHPLLGQDWDPGVVNTGAWQRVATAASLEHRRVSEGIPRGEVLRRIPPQDLAPCYSVVVARAVPGGVDSALCYWKEGPTQTWMLEDDASCPDRRAG
jgi:UDP-2,3-diacylglucosamine pyrophosphatase LpxH